MFLASFLLFVCKLKVMLILLKFSGLLSTVSIQDVFFSIVLITNIGGVGPYRWHACSEFSS